MKPVAYSVSDVLKMVGISRTTFYQLVRSGKIEVRKVGNRGLILSRDLEEWLEGLPTLHDFGDGEWPSTVLRASLAERKETATASKLAVMT